MRNVIGRRGPRTFSSLLLWGLAAGLTGCDSGAGQATEERVLEAERDALLAYLAATETAGGGELLPVVGFDDVLLVVRRSLVEKLVSAALPFERDIAGRYRVRVERAEVTLRTGLALVELSGRVTPVDGRSLSADVTLVGALEIATRPAPGPGSDPFLAGSVEIFGVDTRDVRVGSLSPPAERLVDGLARSRFDALNRALGSIPIPIRLEERIDLPGVEEAEVTIPAGAFEAVFTLGAVRVLEQGIFVTLDVDRTGAGWPVAAAPETSAEGPAEHPAERPGS